jgi:hypothetical protein
MNTHDEGHAKKLAALARDEAEFVARVPDRLIRAWGQTDPDLVNSPLRASGGSGTSGGGISDPTATAALNPTTLSRWTVAELKAERDGMAACLADYARVNRRMAGYLARWAPDPPPDVTVDNDVAGLCENHLRHGWRTPTGDRTKGKRGGEGLCAWCREIRDDFGAPPNGELCRLRERGMTKRFSKEQIARVLNRPADPAPPTSPGPARSDPPYPDQPCPPQRTPPASIAAGTTVDSQRLGPGDPWH